MRVTFRACASLACILGTFLLMLFYSGIGLGLISARDWALAPPALLVCVVCLYGFVYGFAALAATPLMTDAGARRDYFSRPLVFAERPPSRAELAAASAAAVAASAVRDEKLTPVRVRARARLAAAGVPLNFSTPAFADADGVDVSDAMFLRGDGGDAPPVDAPPFAEW